jgi:hypothetical protein
LAIEEYRGAAGALALGARSGSLLMRVRRLLEIEPQDTSGITGSVAGLGALGASIVGLVLWGAAIADEPAPARTAPREVVEASSENPSQPAQAAADAADELQPAGTEESGARPKQIPVRTVDRSFTR